MTTVVINEVNNPITIEETAPNQIIIRNQSEPTGGGGGGVTDHGALTGLGDDDHTQYHNDTRGDLRYEPKNSNIQSHISSTSNPHSVTQSQVGLGNVDNTSDANKPVSTAQQTALDLKANKSGDTFSGPIIIDDALDQVKMTLNGHSTQTSNIFEIYNSTPTFLSGFDGNGHLRMRDASASGASAPQIYFVTGANKTGIGYNSAGVNSELFFTTNGSSRFSIGLAGAVFSSKIFANGNGASSPAICISSSDIDTGLAYISSNTFCAATGGVARMTFSDSLNTSAVRLTTTQLRVTAPTVPATASDTGVAGEIAWDSTYIYICIATNTWKRCLIETW